MNAPSTGATAGEMTTMDWTTASTDSCFRPSYRSFTMAVATAEAALPPTAWRILKKIRCQMSHDTAQATLAAIYSTSPVSRTGRRPYLVGKRPPEEHPEGKEDKEEDQGKVGEVNGNPEVVTHAGKGGKVEIGGERDKGGEQCDERDEAPVAKVLLAGTAFGDFGDYGIHCCSTAGTVFFRKIFCPGTGLGFAPETCGWSDAGAGPCKKISVHVRFRSFLLI